MVAEGSAVILRATPHNAYVSVLGEPQLLHVLIEAEPTPVQGPNAPLNIGFVLDHSGSMEGEKIEHLREAVKLVIQQLSPDDYLSIVIFDHQAKSVVPSTRVGSRSDLFSIVDKIESAGGTRMARGMRRGIDELKKASGDRTSRMLLLTDGQTQDDARECLNLASECGKLRLPTLAMGLGDDWNYELLEGIAERSNGDHRLLERPEEIQGFFDQHLQRMKATAVRDAELILRCPIGVRLLSAYRVRPSAARLPVDAHSEREGRVYLGGLATGEGQWVLAELEIPPRDPGRFQAVVVELRWNSTAPASQQERIIVEFTGNRPLIDSGRNQRVWDLVQAIGTQKLLDSARQDLTTGRLSEGTRKLELATQRLEQSGDREAAAATRRLLDETKTKRFEEVSSGTIIQAAEKTRRWVESQTRPVP